MGLAASNRHRERAALTERALHTHAAAMQFDQFLNECQSDPCAFVSPRVDALDTVKPLEHPVEMLLGNSDSCVTDLQFHYAVHILKCERNLTLERELQGVGEQIQNDLLPHFAIHVHRLCDWLAFH